MTVYRYVVGEKDSECGFLTALDDYFDLETAFALGFEFTKRLPEAEIDMKNTRSYFTQKGNRSFNKAIRNCRKAYEEKGIKFSQEVHNLGNEEIIYQDKYQIIVKTTQ